MTPIPRNHKGQISWITLLANAKPGDQFTFPRAMAKTAPAKIQRAGVPCESTVKGKSGAVVITILDKAPERTPYVDSQALRQAIFRDSQIGRRVKEARENAAYWLRQIHLREHPAAIQQARANHAAWKMTANRLAAQLEAKQATPTPA